MPAVSAGSDLRSPRYRRRVHDADEQQLPHDQSARETSYAIKEGYVRDRARATGGWRRRSSGRFGGYNVLPVSWRCRAMLPAARARSVFTAPLNWAPSSRAKRLAITLASTVALGPMSTLSAVM